MLSAAAGAPSLILALGSGTAYNGSKRSELLTDTTVRGSTRAMVAALRGLAAAATASAGATTGAFTSAAGLASGAGLLSGAVTTFASFETLDDATTEVGVEAETVDVGSDFAVVGGATTTFAAESFADSGEGAAGVAVATTDSGGADGLASTIVEDTEVAAGAACWTTAVGVTAGVWGARCVPELTGLIGGFISGAGCFGAVMVGAGSVVSGRAAPGFGVARTLSAERLTEADRAVKSRTSSISAVGQQGRESVRSKKTAVPHAGPRGSDDPTCGGSRRVAAHHNSRALTSRMPGPRRPTPGQFQLPCRNGTARETLLDVSRAVQSRSRAARRHALVAKRL